MVARSFLASILLLEPLKESLLINQNATTGAADNFIKTVFIGIKNQMAQTANRRPAMMLGPFSERDKSPLQRL
jgi:hypothetical protein